MSKGCAADTTRRRRARAVENAWNAAGAAQYGPDSGIAAATKDKLEKELFTLDDLLGNTTRFDSVTWNPLDVVDPVLEGLFHFPGADMAHDFSVDTWGWLHGGGIVQDDSYECAEGVRCYPNSTLIAGGDPDALTIGNRIFCKTDCERLLEHELIHVEQFRKERGFALRYIVESIWGGTCTNNKFEAPAYSVGGACKP
jgi:hypothetical protein